MMAQSAQKLNVQDKSEFLLYMLYKTFGSVLVYTSLLRKNTTRGEVRGEGSSWL